MTRMESESRKLFCHVRDCAQALRDEPLKIARMREACVLRARSGEPHGKGGVSDPIWKSIADALKMPLADMHARDKGEYR